MSFAERVSHEGDAGTASLRRALAAAETAAELKGRDIVILDMREQTGFFDYFVIVSGSSRRQLHSMSENIDDVLTKREGAKRIGLEGVGDSRWILLDYGDVVVHLFDPELRAYYALEDLWADARRVDFSPSSPSSSSPPMP
ncbi:MAG: hypothetical protein Kow0040_27500 [Thermogutta sp.]